MGKFVLKTGLLEDPDVVFYYKRTDDREGIPMALNTEVAFDIDEAFIFEKDEAQKLCDKLNYDKPTLLEHGFHEFEIFEMIGSNNKEC